MTPDADTTYFLAFLTVNLSLWLLAKLWGEERRASRSPKGKKHP